MPPLRLRAYLPSALALLVFILCGLLAIPLLGFEDDELILVNLFFHPNDAFSRLPLFGEHAIPAMAASYAGALKPWLWSPLLLWATPTVWLVRVPALFLATLTIVLTGRLLRQIAGEPAARAVVILLATDVTFLFTTTFDWGPVVLEELLLVLSLLLLVDFYTQRSQRSLFLGGLTMGLAVWDKSLFLWQLTGLTAAFILVGFPLLKSLLTRANISTFVKGAALGALPLLIANFRHHFATIRDNGHMTLASVPFKAAFMLTALNGQAATTFLVANRITRLDQIHRPFEAAVLALLHALGEAPSLWRFYPGLILLLTALLVAKGAVRRWLLFFLLSGSIAWFESALTRHAGDVVHHAVLVWIEWYSALALSFAVLLASPSIYLRWTSALLLSFFGLYGILVMGAGYGELIAHPGTSRWTNADISLADQLLRAGVKRVIVADWGIRNVLRVRSDDHLTLDNQSVNLMLGRFDPKAFEACQSELCAVVAHAPNRDVFPNVTDTLTRQLAPVGLEKRGSRLVYDTHGTPSFEFYHLAAP